MTSNIQPIFEPDAAQMRRHVGHLFEGWLDGCHEGRIELAWTDAQDGKLRHAMSFGTDELDELVDRAVRENRHQGQNVYIGQALRQPDSAPFGRGKDEDFFALTAFYVDIDVTSRRPPPLTIETVAAHPPGSWSRVATRISARSCCGGWNRRSGTPPPAASRTWRWPMPSMAISRW